MGVGKHWRSLRRLTLIVPLVALLTAPFHGASAAPAGQQAVVDEIGRQVSQVRGLPLSGSTPVTTLSRPELVSRLSKELNTDQAVREFLTSQMLLEVLGAMEQGFDLRQLQLRLLEEQTLAVYDFNEKAMLLVADAAGGDLGSDTRLVIAHESTHALQDQAFNLKRILPADAPNSDAAMAARALVEGDAMLTMRIWGRQFLLPGEKRALGDDTPPPPDPVLDGAPPLVRGELLFPYDAGWIFAQLLYQDGGFDAVNKAFARPPTSTEQILHPEKYTAGEQPVTVTIPPLERWLGSSWVTRRTDVFGELVLRLLLEPTMGWPVAEAAAMGWGGDAYTILEDVTGRRVVAMLTVWDTEGDAAEMYNAWSKSVPLVFKDEARPALSLPSQTRWVTDEYHIQVITTGNTVRLVYAPDAATVDLVDSALASATTGEPASVPAPAPSTLPAPAATVTPADPTEPDDPDSPSDPTAPVEPGNLPAPAAAPSPEPFGPRPGTGSTDPGSPERPAAEPGDSRFSPPTVTASPEPVATPDEEPEPLPTLPPPPMEPPGDIVTGEDD